MIHAENENKTWTLYIICMYQHKQHNDINGNGKLIAFLWRFSCHINHLKCFPTQTSIQTTSTAVTVHTVQTLALSSNLKVHYFAQGHFDIQTLGVGD